MTNAGWYPDPAGTPDTYRYWDGHAWSQATSTAPFGQGQAQPPAPTPPPMAPPAPPVPPAPPTPQPYGALPDTPQQWSPMPGAPIPGPPGGSHTGRTIAIVTAALAFLLLFAILAFVAVRTLGDDAGPSAQPQPATSDAPTTAEPSVPGASPTGPVTPSAPLGSITPTALQCYGGLSGGSAATPGSTLAGGGLTVAMPKGYQATPYPSRQFPFASGVQAAQKAVMRNWASTLAIGGLPRSSGYTGLEQAARAVLACVANNPQLYTDVTGFSEVSANPVTVDGHRAFSLVQDIKVDSPATTATGDTAQVVVVDTGNARSYGVFLMVVPIGDSTYLAVQKSTVAGLRVK